MKKICRSVLLKMRNVSAEILEKIKTHILCSIAFFKKSCHLSYNVEKCGQVIPRCVHYIASN